MLMYSMFSVLEDVVFTMGYISEIQLNKCISEIENCCAYGFYWQHDKLLYVLFGPVLDDLLYYVKNTA